jgi:hypothetical protein
LEKIHKERVRRQEIEKNVKEAEGKDHESQKEDKVEEQVAVLDMPHFMGHHGLKLFNGKHVHEGLRDQDVTITGHEAHDARGEHAPFEDGPSQHMTVPESFFSQKPSQGLRLFRSRKRLASPP